MAALPPSRPGDETPGQETTETPAQAFTRKRLRMLAINYSELAQTPSLGEVLLPLLFAAAETCWVDAIFIGLAGFGLFASREPFMPLWTPFVLIAGTEWIVSRLERRAAVSVTAGQQNARKTTLPGARWLILFISAVILLSIWESIYAQTALYDPRWLLAFLNDLLFLNVHAYHSAAIIGLSLYFCWRGIHLLVREYEPSQAFNTLRLGMIILLVVVLVRAGQFSAGANISNDIALLLLIPIFLFLSLSAHALARITFLRHTHSFGETNIEAQERAVLEVIAAVGLILLLLTLLINTLANPAALDRASEALSWLGVAYEWLVRLVAGFIVLLVTPFFLLINWLLSLLPARHPLPRSGQPARHPAPVVIHSGQALPFLEPVLKAGLLIFLALLILLALRWLVRLRRRVRLVANQRGREIRESLWSWRLLWGQFKGLLRLLFGRFLRRSPARSVPKAQDDLPAAPTARTLREIYRALLRRAATLGYPRQRHETPSEFRQRLDEHVPASEPHLGVITDAYLETRYGGMVPEDAELTNLRQAWSTLEHTWNS